MVMVTIMPGPLHLGDGDGVYRKEVHAPAPDKESVLVKMVLDGNHTLMTLVARVP